MRRLGETAAFSETVLELLENAGWTISRIRAFAGEGVLMVASKEAQSVVGSGPDSAAAATNLLAEVSDQLGRRAVA